MLGDAYHEFEYPREMMLGIVKTLKPGGRVVLLEYPGENPIDISGNYLDRRLFMLIRVKIYSLLLSGAVARCLLLQKVYSFSEMSNDYD